MAGDTGLSSVIDQHIAELNKPGVLSVRPGYKATGGWLTATPAIVVTVENKTADLSSDQLLPTEVGGVPVDVRQASPEKRKELVNPSGFAQDLRLSPDLGAVAHFPDERTLPGVRPAETASAHAALARAEATKPELDYTPPDDTPLDPVEAQATIHICASPDGGWKMLKPFLEATTTTLTVGLYDFTSAHVESTVVGAMAGKQLTLVLDHPAKNPTADLTDTQTVGELESGLGAGLSQSWALARTDPQADAWIFPTAYHIKVAVRDHEAFWLSSGNWNNSNQPDIDPGANTADARTARHYDRDWHVIIEEPTLANTFEQYILHDQQIAAQHNRPPGTAGAPVPPPSLPNSETHKFVQFFDPVTITDTMKIVPVLTPDPGVYAGAAKDLIASATQTLYMQFQYIEPPRAGVTDAAGFLDLIGAVVDRQKAGVDVKIIMSQFETLPYLEQLQGLGLDVVNSAKTQRNVHNKGIVVDAQTVLVSSQNWSTDGTLYNRDAGVIIHNAQAAEYFQTIFLHDWDHLASKTALD
jgi:hypothetical protein